MANLWLTGAGEPTLGTGEQGDYYRDTETNLVYFRENPTTWVEVPAFTPSPDGVGTTWLYGTGAPLNGLGSNGNYYFDNDVNTVYFKVLGAWEAKGSLDFIGVYGVQWGNGTGAPANIQPLNDLPAGSFYLDVATSDIYYKNPTLVWDLKGQLGSGSTGLDVVATAADRVQTGLDRVQTAADRVQTGLDRVQTAADRVQTGLDAIATAADRVQTGLDVITTAADRVQTGLYLDEALAAVSVGVGSLAVQTLAALNAITTAPTNSIGYVTNDGTSANNGMYQWNGTAWTQSIYDPLTQAKTYTDAKITDRNHLADSFLYVGLLTSTDDLNALTVKDGTYVATSTPLHPPSGETGQAIIKVEKQGAFTVQTYQRLNDSRYIFRRTIQDGQTPEAWRDLSLINFSVSRSNLADNFLYTGVLTSTDDLNTTQKDGAYVATSTPLHPPSGETGQAIIKVEKQGSFTVQTYQRLNDSRYVWKRTIQDGQTPEAWRDLSLINFSVSRTNLADNFLYTGVLTSSNDLNTLTVKDGTYVATSTPLHPPSGESGQAIVKVEKQGSFTVQTYQRLNDSRYLWKRTIQDGQTPEVWRDLSLINFSVSRTNLADNFLYTGVLTSTDDLNTIEKDGAYVATSVPINAPVGAPAIAHITVAKAGSMVRQTYTDVHDASISWSRNFQTVVIVGVPSIVSDGWMRGSLEIATISKLGGIKVGAGLLVAEDGTLSVTVPTQQNPFAGKKMVCFGDSITEFKNYPDQVRNILGLAEAYNVGFGGCQMTAHNDVAYKEMCMYRLADYIATGNYTGLTAAANDLYTRLSDDNRAIAARLAAIDFNTVDYITIFYGTNDWANKPGSLGLVTEKTPDGSTFLGSANYVVDRLQTAYPHLKIMFLSPIYRTRLVSGDNKNTDDYTNSSGEYMYQYVEGLQAVAKKNHVLCVDLYNESGINKYTAGLYLLPQPDGLHLSDTGATLIASKISAKMKANF